MQYNKLITADMVKTYFKNYFKNFFVKKVNLKQPLPFSK